MKPFLIEVVLGNDAVADVEAAFKNAADSSRGHPEAAEALRQLLTAFLAAAIINPAEGAEQRLFAVSSRLSEIVAEALKHLPTA